MTEIKVFTKNGQMVETVIRAGIKEYRVEKDCSLKFKVKSDKYKVYAMDRFCYKRFDLEGIKDFTRVQMNQIIETASNVYGKTYHEPIRKEFIKKNE